jgi:hypothetical protein
MIDLFTNINVSIWTNSNTSGSEGSAPSVNGIIYSSSAVVNGLRLCMLQSDTTMVSSPGNTTPGSRGVARRKTRGFLKALIVDTWCSKK